LNSPNSNPDDAKGPPSRVGSESWVLKGLADVREDIQKIDSKLEKSFEKIDNRLQTVEDRLATVEGRLSKLLWTVTGAIIVLGLLFGGFEILTTYFDVEISPKS